MHENIDWDLSIKIIETNVSWSETEIERSDDVIEMELFYSISIFLHLK